MNGSSYKFRLERIRALRERSEEQAKQHLASAMQSRGRCQQQLDSAAGRIQQARLSQQWASAEDLLAHQAYLERMERDHLTHQQTLTEQDTAVVQRRHALIEAAQERQTLERLKQRGLDEFTRESARVEQNTLDEIATGAFWRRAV